jgi:hypothetical protein
MFPKQLDIDIAFDGFSLAASVPLTPIERAWKALVARNALSRSRDDDPTIGMLRVRVQCVECCAPIFLLTVVDREGVRVRACRQCRAEFPLEA